MTVKSKTLLIALGCLALLAVVEQVGLEEIYFSKTFSISSTNVDRKPLPADGPRSEVSVKKPLTRWLPFVKFGETVHRRISQDRPYNGTVYESEVTTRTRVWLVGFCSTARYDALASQPFEKAPKKYQP
jgi:hypothetical protein